MRQTNNHLVSQMGTPSGEESSRVKTVKRHSRKVQFNVDIELFYERMAMVRIVYELPNSVMEHVRQYLDSFHKLRVSSGEEYAVNLFKEFANFFKVATLGGQPTPPRFCKFWKGKLVWIAPLDKINDLGHANSKVFSQTVSLFYLVQSTHKCAVDLSTIDGPSDDVDESMLHDFRTYINTDPLRIKGKTGLKLTSKVRVTGAQGVYGQSFYSIPFERRVLRESKLRDTLLDLYTKTGRTFLSDLLLDEEYQTKVPDRGKYLRRLSVLYEPGNKLRYITVGDFFSQNALLPIHENLMGLLKSIKSDATYTSSEACIFLAELPSKRKGTYYCYDLKNFTDLLPLSLQKEVVVFLYGHEIADLWTKLMREPIMYKGKTLNFTRGQPMGLLSSWAVASLTHHLLVNFASFKYRSVKRVTYRLLGDDIVIWGKEASLAYKRLLDELKIPTSDAKTLISRTGFEFCKRRFKDGLEITPAPVKALVDKNWTYAAYELLRVSRGTTPMAVMQLDMYLMGLDSSVHVTERSVQLFVVWNALRNYRMQTSQTGADYTWGRQRFKSLLVKASRKHIEARLKELEPDLQKILKFNPNKQPVPVTIGSRVRKVRGITDRATTLVYTIVATQYSLQLTNIMSQMDEEIGDVSDHQSWSVIIDLSLMDLDFYVLDPEKRFSPRRPKELISQLSTIVGVLNQEARATIAMQSEPYADRLDDDFDIEAYQKELAGEEDTPQNWQGAILSFGLSLQDRLRDECEPFNYGEDVVRFLSGEDVPHLGAVPEED